MLPELWFLLKHDFFCQSSTFGWPKKLYIFVPVNLYFNYGCLAGFEIFGFGRIFSIFSRVLWPEDSIYRCSIIERIRLCFLRQKKSLQTKEFVIWKFQNLLDFIFFICLNILVIFIRYNFPGLVYIVLLR